MARTPAIAAAERAGIAFSVHEYDHDPAAESYGLEAAEALGLDAARVFKTLVVDVDGKLAVAIVPVASQVDQRSFGKRVAMADGVRAESAKGYVLGGISPLGQRKPLPTVVDSTALQWDRVLCSAGKRGWDVALDPRDLVRLTKAVTADIRAE